MPERRMRKTTNAVRYGIPAGLALVGAVILVVDQSSTGVEGWGDVHRGGRRRPPSQTSSSAPRGWGDVELDEEESARAYFEAHGD
ncbi:MAG: hypothetical protein ACR2KV_15685 [Solirubrobacteraceae bacterium]